MTNKQLQEILADHEPNLEIRFDYNDKPPLFLGKLYSYEEGGILFIQVADDEPLENN